MKNFSFGIFNVVSVCLIILSVIRIIFPFNLINLEQAQRIAKWKSEYERLSYCFSLVNLYESSVIPSDEEAETVVTPEYIIKRLKPYFNLNEINNPPKYTYRKMNGKPVNKREQFYFDGFFTEKNGTVLSVKQNDNDIKNDKQPLYFMFVDINGAEKPNRIGLDIFFINIFKNHITALGADTEQVKLKADCSPIGSGIYCSEYYLLGGIF